MRRYSALLFLRRRQDLLWRRKGRLTKGAEVAAATAGKMAGKVGPGG
jgi:hypothetical protein